MKRILTTVIAAVAAVFFMFSGAARIQSQILDDPSAQITQLENLLKTNPDNVDLLFTLEKLYATQQRYGDAIAALEKITALQPQNAAALSELGYMLDVIGKHDEALAAHKKALAADPEYPLGHINIGLSYYYTRQNDKAYAAFETALQINKKKLELIREWPAYTPDEIAENITDQVFYLSNIALCYLFTNRPYKALEYLEIAQSYAPEDPHISALIEKTYQNIESMKGSEVLTGDSLQALQAARGKILAGDPQGALEIYNKLLAQGIDSLELHINMGKAFDMLGDQINANAHYVKATEINPENPVAFYNLGVSYAENGKDEEAFRAFSRSVTINPDYAPALAMLGKIEAGRTMYGPAEEHLSRAMRLAPNIKGPREQLCAIYTSTARQGQAVALGREWLKASPDSPDAAACLVYGLHLSGNDSQALEIASKALEKNPINQQLASLIETVKSSPAQTIEIAKANTAPPEPAQKKPASKPATAPKKPKKPAAVASTGKKPKPTAGKPQPQKPAYVTATASSSATATFVAKPAPVVVTASASSSATATFALKPKPPQELASTKTAPEKKPAKKPAAVSAKPAKKPEKKQPVQPVYITAEQHGTTTATFADRPQPVVITAEASSSATTTFAMKKKPAAVAQAKTKPKGPPTRKDAARDSGALAASERAGTFNPAFSPVPIPPVLTEDLKEQISAFHGDMYLSREPVWKYDPDKLRSLRDGIKGIWIFQDTNNAIWFYSPSDHKLQRLADGMQPALSADAKTLVFITREKTVRMIQSLDIATLKKKTLLEARQFEKGKLKAFFRLPALSPNGKYLSVLVDTGDGSFRMVLKNLSTGTILAPMPGYDVAGYGWMPDGDRLIFTAEPCGKDTSGNAVCAGELRVSTGEVSWLASDVKSPSGQTVLLGGLKSPSPEISPSGRYLMLYETSGYSRNIVVLDTANNTAESFTPVDINGGKVKFDAVSWSPDESALSFLFDDNTWVMDRDGRNAFPAEQFFGGTASPVIWRAQPK